MLKRAGEIVQATRSIRATWFFFYGVFATNESERKEKKKMCVNVSSDVGKSYHKTKSRNSRNYVSSSV